MNQAEGPTTAQSCGGESSALLFIWPSIVGHGSTSVLVSHGSLLKANRWKLLGEGLNVILEFSNFWRDIGLQICLEVLQLGSMLLLQVLSDLHSPAAPKSMSSNFAAKQNTDCMWAAQVREQATDMPEDA